MTENGDDNKVVMLARWRSAPPVDDQPSAVVASWAIMRLPSEEDGGEYDFRIVGRKENGGWRVTTPLVHLDLTSMTGTTQSGRHYRLDGPMVDVYDPPDIIADVIWSWIKGTGYQTHDVGISMPEDVVVALAPTTGPRM